MRRRIRHVWSYAYLAYETTRLVLSVIRHADYDGPRMAREEWLECGAWAFWRPCKCRACADHHARTGEWPTGWRWPVYPRLRGGL